MEELNQEPVLFGIKLVSGETIVSSLKEERDDLILIETPLSLQEMHNGSTSLLYFTEWIRASDDNLVLLRKSSIVGIYKPSQTLINHYNLTLEKILSSKLASFDDSSDKEKINIPPPVLKQKTIH